MAEPGANAPAAGPERYAAPQEREAWHRLVVEEALDYAILTIDADGRVTSWAPGAEAVFGWPAADIVGRPSDVLFTPEDRAAGEPEKERATAARDGTAPDVRWHLRRDGARVFIDGIARAVRGADGALRGFVKVGRDVTQRRRTEAALHESEERFRLVADLVPDLLWQSESGGWTSWYNQRWYAYTGQTPAQAEGHGWLAAVHPEDREASRAAFVAATVAGRPLRWEYRLRGVDGAYRWFLVRAEPFREDDGRVVQWFGAATDVHAQRIALHSSELAREEADAARREVERLVADRTAELRAVNARLAAEAQARARSEAERDLLRRRLASAEDEERRRLARELHDVLGQALTALSFEVKALEAHLPAGEGAARLARVRALVASTSAQAHDIAHALRPVVLGHGRLALALEAHAREWERSTGVAVDVHAEEVVPPLTPDQEAALYRIMQEALTNVARHAGAARASVTLGRIDGEVRLVVEDDGRGFDPDAARERARAQHRIGLLSMAERAALAGGTLALESVPGAGATLVVRIPVAPSGDAAARQPAGSAAPGA